MAWTNFVSGSLAIVNIFSGGFGSNAQVENEGRYLVQSGGRLSGASISSGGTLGDNGGSVASATILNGASVFVGAGGSLVDSTVDGGSAYINDSATVVSNLKFTSNGGQVYINSGYSNKNTWGDVTSNTSININGGSTLYGATILSGAKVAVFGGNNLNGVTLNGGTITLYGENKVSNTTFGSNGGTINLQSGYSNTVPWQDITSNTTFNVRSGAVLSGTNVLSGGTVTVGSGGALSGTLSVNPGGTIVLNGTAGNGIINLSGDGSQLTISGTQMPTNVISGWSPTDKIDLASIPLSSIKSTTTTASGVTFHTTSGDYSLNIPGANKYGTVLSNDGRGNTLYTTCFAEGTLIATPDGNVAVEDLQVGTHINTLNGSMPLKWLGHRSITVGKQERPEENWLVRICASALADGVPARDLLVTQEHCMVFDGKLVPARMLVNNRSIIIDRSINAYTYYHVELETHAAIWAEGALTESYLDTGNRGQFENHTVIRLVPSREAGGSELLPLDTSRDFVEPIFRAIADRVGAVVSQAGLTDDADLHLITDAGVTIRPNRVNGQQYMFFLPENAEAVTIMSRTSRPSDIVGPFVDDRRDLGVLVGQIKLFSANVTTSIDAPFVHADLRGWHALEGAEYRWTDGAALLPVGCALKGELRMLTVQVCAQGPYRLEVQQALSVAS